MFMNMNIILFYNMWLLLRTGYLTYTREREVMGFFSLLVWIVQRWLGRNLIYQLCWRGVDRSSKGSTQASDAGVDNECHLSTFMNYWNQFPQLSRLPLTDPPY